MPNETKEAPSSNGESPEDQELAKALATWPVDEPIPLAKTPSIYRERFESLQALYSTKEIVDLGQFKRYLSETVFATLKECVEELPYLPRVIDRTGECLLALFLEPADAPTRFLSHLCTEQSMSECLYCACLECTFDIDSIKYLIAKHPYALTWPPLAQHRKYSSSTTFQYICCQATARLTVPLVPWIIKNHGGYLCIEDKPQHHLLFTFCARHMMFDVRIVQRFYKLYPNAVQQRGRMITAAGFGDLPVHILARWRVLGRSDSALFRWLLQHTSFENLKSQKDISGRTLWHIVAGQHADPEEIPIPFANIILDEASSSHLLIKQEELVTVVSNLVLKGSDDRDEAEDKLLVRLLCRMYSSKHLLDEHTLKDHHVQRILQTLDQQHQLSMNSIAIKRVHGMISKALQLDKGTGKDLEEVNEVYNDWATKHLAAIANKLPKIRDELFLSYIDHGDDSDDNHVEE